eukprot:gene11823-13720_t
MQVTGQVNVLKNRFPAPAAVRLLCHKTHDEGTVASCCESAQASIRGAVVASAASEGITGVIEYFTTNYSWGCLQSRHFCECVENRNNLYCVATTCVGLECLRIYKSLSEHKQFDLMVVEFIFTECASAARTKKQYLKEAFRKQRDTALSFGWVLDDTYYHVLIGLVDLQSNLTICEHDASMPFIVAENGSSTRIQSMRVSQWAGDALPTRSFSHVNWNGTQIALNRWVDDFNTIDSSIITTATETLGKVYGAEPHHHTQVSLCPASHPSTTSLTTTSANSEPASPPETALLALPTEIPTVFVSGTYMGPNPCPGVGIARALRAALGTTGVRLISVGDAEFSDPVFDAHWPVLELGAAAYLTGPMKTQTQWNIVTELILAQQTEASAEFGDCPVFFIPGCDADIDLLSLGKDAVQHALNVGSQPDTQMLNPLKIDPTWSVAQMEALNRSILCPDAATVALTAKPYIVAASCGPLGDFFKVPEFFLLDASDGGGDYAPTAGVSLLEMRMFADRIGYPVLIKAAKQGALVCHSWLQLRGVITTQTWVQQGGAFIQKCIRGWEKCIAFAAFDGHLLGCCLMTKASYTEKGKVWSGDIEPVPTSLSDALQEFVQQTNWTGGGEIEFIEEIVPSGALRFDADLHQKKRKWSDDMFVPRSSVPTRDEASGEARNHLLSTQPNRWVVDFNPRFPAWIFASAYSGCNLPALLLAAAVRDCTVMKNRPKSTGGADESPYFSSTSDMAVDEPLVVPHSVAFVRSLIEVPVVHTPHNRVLPRLGGGSFAGVKGKAGLRAQRFTTSCSIVPQTDMQVLQSNPCGVVSQGTSEAFRHLANDLRRLTTTAKSLIRANAIECTSRYILCTLTLEITLQRMQKLFAEAAVPSQLPVQLCLSVKTQPHTALIQLAAQAGYLAECIDLAEVYHAVLNGGYSFDQIVLTGPAKWWDNKSTEGRSSDLAGWEQSQASSVTSCGVAKKFHAIFADSLSDLQDLTERLQDPDRSIDTDVVGIRWVPFSAVNSRFGLNCKDAKVVRKAAELVRQLPENYRLGMHFHHASSVLGGERWFSLAQAFCVFSGEFAQLCGRPIATIDFGGGFEPYFLESAYAQEKLRELFQTVHHTCRQQSAVEAPIVQFELGKCISEPAGGVLTRILAIRERDNAYSDEQEEVQQGAENAPRAVIVDTTVADLSTPNAHPVFWVKQSVDTDNATVSVDCVPLAGGPVEIWGRTCMEWDKVFGSFALPAAAKVGDYLLIAGCGAYDMSMQYNFGDGVVRTDNVVVL